MFTIKRPIIVITLILLLILTGYVNHNLTKRASSRISSEYQKYEEMELAKEKNSEDNDLVAAISEGNENDFEIIDSQENENTDSENQINNNVNQIVQDTEGNISETISNQESLKSKNYFIEQRLSRDKLRAGLIDRLNQIVNNENSSQEMITEAQRKIMEIGDISEKELKIEGLIKAKGFNEALVFLTETDAKVVVNVDELTEQDVVKILNIVINETDLDASNVKIMKKY